MTRSASPSSVAVTSPPSPRANRFFVGKKLKVESAKGKSALKSYSLKKATKHLEANEKTKLKLKLPKKAYKKAKAALENGGKVTANVSVKVTDADDDVDKDNVKVKLKKP